MHTGAGNFTVLLALPPARNSFHPKLKRVCSNGNGSFGLGWSLSIPSTSRKTSTRVLQYRGGNPRLEERDIFILFGQEFRLSLQSNR
jgi:hypothetical protein